MRRGLGPAPLATTTATATAAAALIACGVLIVVVSCEDSGGAREEGMVHTGTTASVKAYASASPGTGAGLVALVKQDPRIAVDIREDLVACDDSAGSYPVDAHFGDLTGTGTGSSAGTDMVVNISTCADGVGIGSYVYRLSKGRYHNVFVDEQPPVVAGIDDDGELKVTHQVYGPQDPVSNPSGEDITTYRWMGTGFTETSSTHRTYASKDRRDSHG